MKQTDQTPPSDNVALERLKSLQGITVNLARDLFASYLSQLDEKLAEYAETAKSNKDQTRFLEQQRQLKKGREQLGKYFLGYLGEGFVKFKNKDLNTTTGEEKFQGDMLSLVDNDDLEETIAISSVTRRAENHYAEQLWALNQRFAMLNNGEKVTDAMNPVGPIQFCESLRKALKPQELENRTKIIVYKVFDKEFMPHLGDIFEEITRFLIDHDILPNLRLEVVNQGYPDAPLPEMPEAEFDAQAEGEADAAAPPPPGQPGPAPAAGGAPRPTPGQPQYQQQLMGAIRSLQRSLTGGEASAGWEGMVNNLGAQQPGAGAGDSGAGAPVGPVYSSDQLVSALQTIQSQARGNVQEMLAEQGEVVLQPQQVLAITNKLKETLQEEEGDKDLDPDDLQVIDLVGMLFDYMLNDENLPDSVKALLSYLHTPFLKVGFMDKDFFEQTEHPARLLLNSLAEAGSRWVSADGTSQFDIYPKIKEVVQRVLDDFDSDPRLFAELLLEFSTYTKKISRRVELLEKRAMEKAQGEEKLREVKLRVNQEIRGRIKGRDLPSAVLLLLLQPWSDYLAFILLRYGDSSESWGRGLTTVDNILWSIEPKEGNADKTRMLEIHDELFESLEKGFETIGYDQVKGKKLLDTLQSLQRMAMQNKNAEPAPQPMRAKLESMAAEKAGHDDDTGEAPTKEEQQIVENLKMIEFGTWFEFEGGKRLKVAWYNAKTLHYMLVDQMGKKVAMKSGLELARAMLAGKAKVIAGSTKPFFERALESIYQNLNARAESMKASNDSE